jgi:hypothetical protein
MPPARRRRGMGTNLGIKEKIGAENGFTKACSGF